MPRKPPRTASKSTLRAANPKARGTLARQPDDEASPQRGGVTGAAFWALIDRWGIPDVQALKLIGHAGGQTRTGKRPRFRLSPEQAELLGYLREIDEQLVGVTGEDAGKWLMHSTAPAFKGRTPLDHMIRGGRKGISDVLRFLMRKALEKSV